LTGLSEQADPAIVSETNAPCFTAAVSSLIISERFDNGLHKCGRTRLFSGESTAEQVSPKSSF
jgi:hypothetical protein